MPATQPGRIIVVGAARKDARMAAGWAQARAEPSAAQPPVAKIQM